VLRPTSGHTSCEWKGRASYVDLVTAAATAPRAGWSYPEPIAGFEALVGHVAVMPSLVDAVLRRRRAGRAPGGRLLRRLGHQPASVGPFKGVPGSWGW
jgi:hypothetical protein